MFASAALPLDGCIPYENPGHVRGKVAIVRRGICPFADKIIHAANAGASAIIIVNNDAPMGRPTLPILSHVPNLPAVLVMHESGEKLLEGARKSPSIPIVAVQDEDISQETYSIFTEAYNQAWWPESAAERDEAARKLVLLSPTKTGERERLAQMLLARAQERFEQ